MNKFNVLLNFIFFIIFFVHVSIIFYESAYPGVPQIKFYNKKLSEITFPLLFKICLFETEAEDREKRFTKFGYEGYYGYFHLQLQ